MRSRLRSKPSDSTRNGTSCCLAPAHQRLRARVELDGAQERVELLLGQAEAVEQLEVVLPGVELAALGGAPRAPAAGGRRAASRSSSPRPGPRRCRRSRRTPRDRCASGAAAARSRARRATRAPRPSPRDCTSGEPSSARGGSGPAAGIASRERASSSRGWSSQLRSTATAELAPLRHEPGRCGRVEEAARARGAARSTRIDLARERERLAQERRLLGPEPREVVGEHDHAAARRDRPASEVISAAESCVSLARATSGSPGR